MARAAARALSPSPMENMDPVLVNLAETATFDCDWPTLRHHFYLGLLAALPMFVEQGPPATYAGLIMIEPAPSPTSQAQSQGQQAGHNPADGPLPPWAERDGAGPGPPGPPQGGLPLARHDNPELRPSTMGGLVIPPFPPLDPERRRRPGSSPRINGAPPGPRGNPFEDERDDEVIIGGRKLPGWLEEDDRKKEVDKVTRKLEELSYPPFTVQRLAELLIAPTRLHSTLGKFLRAVDKMLNVTTAYAVPSYTYVPPAPLLIHELDSPVGGATPALRSDINSTVPPGSMTPLFSPIPFLASGDMDALGEPMMDGVEGAEDGLMSPLMLESGGAGSFAQQQGRRRSPTPEPDDAEMADADEPPAEPVTESEAEAAGGEPGAEGGSAEGVSAAEAVAAAAEASQTTASAAAADAPSHQSYLGRVDELDAGPITTNGHHADDDELSEAGSVGVGERGDMTPHGMSERPVPLSSTTVIAEAEREIAPLRRSASRLAAEDVDMPEGEGEAAAEAEASAAAEGEAGKEETKPEADVEKTGEAAEETAAATASEVASTTEKEDETKEDKEDE